MGHLLVIWSARLVVLLYFLRLAADLWICTERRREFWGLVAWTTGCAILLVHMGLAFHFEHRWSQAAADAHAARLTFEVVGINFGGGMYFNYAFALLWVVDVAWWWNRFIRRRPTPRAVFWTIHGIFAFMLLNATVVFGPPFWRWLVPAAVAGLLAGRFALRRPQQLQRTVSRTSGDQPWN